MGEHRCVRLATSRRTARSCCAPAPPRVDRRPFTAHGPSGSARYARAVAAAQSPAYRVVEHYPLGDSTTDAYCGSASNAPYSPLCPIAPAATAACSIVRSLATTAASVHGELLAYERRNPVVVRATAMRWSAGWSADLSTDTLTPTLGGASAAVKVDLPHGAVDYQAWVGGSSGGRSQSRSTGARLAASTG